MADTLIIEGMWIVAILLFVLVCGASGGLVQALTGQPGRSSTEVMGSRSEHAVIGAITALIVVGLLSQSAFSEAVKKLFPPTDTAEMFQALVLVASVALAAGFAGQRLLKRVSDSLLQQFSIRTDKKIAAAEEKIAIERKIRDLDSTILRAGTKVRDGDSGLAIQMLEPIVSDSKAPDLFLARAHGIIANAKKQTGLLNEALKHVDEAHRLSPDDYRFPFNRAYYRWMLSDDAIEEVLRDLRLSIEKGLSIDDIERDEDLETLRKHERFREFIGGYNRRMSL